MVDANDPIPGDGIFLTDAFELVFHLMHADWRNLEAFAEAPIVALQTSSETNDELNKEPMDEAFIKYDLAQLKANHWIRSQISDGSLMAFITTPALGKPWQLPREGWTDVGLSRSGITSNFVGPDDILNPGPDAEIDAYRRPVFFNRDDFESAVKAAFGSIAKPDQHKRLGAPPKHDWDEGRLYAGKLFDERGDFCDIQNQQDDWRTEMDLVRAVMIHMSKHNNGKEPGLSSTKVLVSKVVAQKRFKM
jgi:hypothetical protein